MITIHVKCRNGSTTEIVAEAGLTLMENLRDSGLGEIEALCGGCCSCSTCHVYISRKFAQLISPLGLDEDALLKESDWYRPELSRLACQIETLPEMQGIEVEIAPTE